jgi:hypothetical protein
MAERIKRVLAELWKHCQTYQVQYQLPDGRLQAGHVWYISDEVGLGIRHSDSPNIVTIPFMTVNGNGERVTFNLFWPIKDIASGEFVTRNVVPSALEGLSKDVYLGLFKGDVNIRPALESLWEMVSFV